MFSSATMKRSIQLYYTCGTSGYKLLLDQGHPLPSVRTIQRYMKKVPFQTGTLHAIIEKMRTKVEKMHPKERNIALVVDEISLQPKREYDSSTGSFFGMPTMHAPKKTVELRENQGHMKEDRLARHAQCVMAVGLGTRWKQLVGYHLTDTSFDADEMYVWLLELIHLLQSIGLKIYSLTMDMGPGNKAL